MSGRPSGDFERVLGHLRGAAPGPTLLVVAGIHGNEPAGVYAARRVLAHLAETARPTRGEIIALAGNLAALRAGRRYLARDLNRQWSEARLGAIAAGAAWASGDAEAEEQVALQRAVDAALARARGDVYFLDLHTTSAAGIPFGLAGRSERERHFAAHFPLPILVGLDRQLEGVLCQYLSAKGAFTLVVEGGQNESADAVGNLEAALWLALDAARLAPAAVQPLRRAAFDRLDRARGDLPRSIEVMARYAVRPEHPFRMQPGFANIARVQAGQLLAHDGEGEVRTPIDGLVLMPLYQGQGDDGFFIGRELAASPPPDPPRAAPPRAAPRARRRTGHG